MQAQRFVATGRLVAASCLGPVVWVPACLGPLVWVPFVWVPAKTVKVCLGPDCLGPVVWVPLVWVPEKLVPWLSLQYPSHDFFFYFSNTEASFIVLLS